MTVDNMKGINHCPTRQSSGRLAAAADLCVSAQMSYISEAIAEIHMALDSNPNERHLLDLIDQNLTSLRSRYRTHRSEFTDGAIQFLKSLSPFQEALREFIDAIEEKDWIRTRDDAQELAGRFGELRDRLFPHLVFKRAEKELREVTSKAQSLPFAAVVAGEAEFNRRLAHLERNAQPCQKCGAKMALRESQHGYFWGCSTFPQCFSRRWLSSEESEFLFP